MKTIINSISFTFLILFLTGCISTAKVDNPDVQKTASVSKAVNEALSSSSFYEGNWPKENWWIIFGDDQLDQMVTLAIENNPTMKKAQSQVELSYQRAKMLKSQIFPHLYAHAEDKYQYLSKDDLYRHKTPGMPAVVNQINIGLDLSYEFNVWGKHYRLYEAALGKEQAKEAETAYVKLILSMHVANEYFLLQTNEEKLLILEKYLEIEKEKHGLIIALIENGLDSEININIEEQKLLEIEKEIVSLKRDIVFNKAMLNTLMGKSADADLSITLINGQQRDKFPLPGNVELDLISRRPDVMAQVWTIQSIAKEVGAAQADFFPNIDLNALGGVSSLSFNNIFSKNSLMGFINPAIHLPIFVGGRLRAHLHAKLQEFEIAIQEYNSLLLEVSREVVDVLTAIKSVNEQIVLQKKDVDAAFCVYELISYRYQQGLDSYLPVITSNEQVLSQQLKEIDLKRNRYLSVVKLIKTLGGGYQSPVDPSAVLDKEKKDG